MDDSKDTGLESSSPLGGNVYKLRRGKNGRFLSGPRGFPTNPTGENGMMHIEELCEALNRESKRRGYKDFFDVVAKRVHTSDQVMIAVLRKIVPDKQDHSGKITFTQEERDACINRIKILIGIGTN